MCRAFSCVVEEGVCCDQCIKIHILYLVLYQMLGDPETEEMWFSHSE